MCDDMLEFSLAVLHSRLSGVGGAEDEQDAEEEGAAAEGEELGDSPADMAPLLFLFYTLIKNSVKRLYIQCQTTLYTTAEFQMPIYSIYTYIYYVIRGLLCSIRSRR